MICARAGIGVRSTPCRPLVIRRQLKRRSLGAILVTQTRVSRMGLAFGRLAGLMLAGVGAFAGLTLYSEFKAWTEPIYVRVALLVPTGGAVAFALIQGVQMFFAKTTAELTFTAGIRILAATTIMSELVLGFLLILPAAAARGPLPALALVVQTALVIGGFVAALRSAGWRRRMAPNSRMKLPGGAK